MNEYIRVDVVGAGEVHKYLSEGWEIIETAKFTSNYDQLDTRLDYHIGLPARVMVDQLMAIIKDYEEQGLKEKLFEGVAQSFSENASDYEQGAGNRTSSETARYMEKYEKIVSNRNVTVYKKFTQEELKQQAEFEF